MSFTGGSAAKNTVRLKGYSIRISNASNVPPNATDACFTDKSSSTLPTDIQEECERTTRYIWFYQRQNHNSYAPILEICEVQVFGKLRGPYYAVDVTYFVLISLSFYQL